MKVIFTILFSISLGITTARQLEDFSLYSVTNNKVFTLSEARGEYVALHFLLKTECPVCLRYTMEYFNNQDQLEGVKHVFIKPDTEQEIKEWAGHLKTEELDQLPIFRDPDAQLAAKLMIPSGYEFHNEIVHYPALVLIDPQGKEVFRYVGKNNSDRYTFDLLSEKLQKLKGGKINQSDSL
jgi:peroxiredoxin Q/BCP